MKLIWNHKKWLVALAIVAFGALVLTACSDDNETDSTTSTTIPPGKTNFEVDTRDGQVSLSLDGKLPPGWPADFPIPKGATPAGSGSLGGKETTNYVGVYRSPDSASDTFEFYKDNSDLDPSDSASAGSGSSFAGSVKIAEPAPGRVTTVTYESGSLIIVALQTPATTTTTAK